MKRKLPVVGSPSIKNPSDTVHSKSIPIVRYQIDRHQASPRNQMDSRSTPSLELGSQSPDGLVSNLSTETNDWIAVEEPMEIRLVFGPLDQRQSTSLSITMRTPGDDFQLALGFLISEGIAFEKREIEAIQFCGPVTQADGSSNITKISLCPSVSFSLKTVQRHFYTTSSCGICGKASLDAVELTGLKPLAKTLLIPAEQILLLPGKLRDAQLVFQQTGGLHASGVFTADGELECLKEDVGRHNALDKVVGFGLQNELLPWKKSVLVVSGRASFELVQKAIMAGLQIMVAVGAPSSLAVDLANRFGLTLIGFASQQRFNIYTHPERIQAS